MASSNDKFVPIDNVCRNREALERWLDEERIEGAQITAAEAESRAAQMAPELSALLDTLEFTGHGNSQPNLAEFVAGCVAFCYVFQRRCVAGESMASLARFVGISEMNFHKRVMRLRTWTGIGHPLARGWEVRERVSAGMTRKHEDRKGGVV